VQQQIREQRRAPRVYLSGAAKRKKNDTQEQQAETRERDDRTYLRSSATKNSTAKARCSAKPTLLNLTHDEWREEEERNLLGEHFFHEWQAVRVTAERGTFNGDLRGQIGFIDTRALVCRDGENGSLDPAHIGDDGRVELTEDRYNRVFLFDGDGLCDAVQLSPYELEAWPRIGQRVRQFDVMDQEGNAPLEGTVTKYYRGLDASTRYYNGDRAGSYLCVRQLYADRTHVESMTGDTLQVSSWARLRPGHPDALHSYYKDESEAYVDDLIAEDDAPYDYSLLWEWDKTMLGLPLRVVDR